MKGHLIFANFDARISDIDIRPKNKATKVVITSMMYDEHSNTQKTIQIIFSNVAAIDFRINYIDNMIGSEAFCLYQMDDKTFIDNLVKEIFERRKEIYLLEGNYDYDESDPNDMLNILDLDKSFLYDFNSYHAYVQNVDAGVYIIIAKEIQVI